MLVTAGYSDQPLSSLVACEGLRSVKYGCRPLVHPTMRMHQSPRGGKEPFLVDVADAETGHGLRMTHHWCITPLSEVSSTIEKATFPSIRLAPPI